MASWLYDHFINTPAFPTLCILAVIALPFYLLLKPEKSK